LAPKAPARLLKGHAEQLYSVDFSTDGKLATGNGNGVVVLWDLSGPHRIAQTVQKPTGKPAKVVFGRDSMTLVSSSKDELRFWDLVKGMPVASSVVTTQSGISLILLAPDGRAMVTVGIDNSVQAWDTAKRVQIKTLVQPSKETILSAAFSADSRTLALGVKITEKESEIRLLSLPDGTLKETLVLPAPDQVWALAFSPNKKLLASAGWNSGITIWDLTTSKSTETLNHINVFSLAFTPNGKILASGGKDSLIRLWYLEKDPQNAVKLAYHRGPVLSMDFSLDGKLLTSAGSDKTVLLWDAETGQRMSPPLQGHWNTVLSVALSPDGQWLASSAEDGSIILWNFSMVAWESQACQTAGRNFSHDEWRQYFGKQEFRITCPSALIKEADYRALTGDRSGAEQRFAEALDVSLMMKDPEPNNVLCWFGSIHGFAEMVKPACERAVALAPEVSKGWSRDSRGLARALTGETAGAIEDFTAAVDSIRNLKDISGSGTAFLQRREEWIAQLKDGRNPFNESLLKSLRTKPY
jgi:WD40 repeat protein